MKKLIFLSLLIMGCNAHKSEQVEHPVFIPDSLSRFHGQPSLMFDTVVGNSWGIYNDSIKGIEFDDVHRLTITPWSVRKLFHPDTIRIHDTIWIKKIRTQTIKQLVYMVYHDDTTHMFSKVLYLSKTDTANNRKVMEAWLEANQPNIFIYDDPADTLKK